MNEKIYNYKTDLQTQLTHFKADFERNFLAKHESYQAYKNLAVTLQVETEQLRNELDALNQKYTASQSELKDV